MANPILKKRWRFDQLFLAGAGFPVIDSLPEPDSNSLRWFDFNVPCPITPPGELT